MAFHKNSVKKNHFAYSVPLHIPKKSYEERQLNIIFQILHRHHNRILGDLIRRFNKCKRTDMYREARRLYKSGNKKDGGALYQKIFKISGFEKYPLKIMYGKQAYCEKSWQNHVGQQILNNAATNVVETFFDRQVFGSWTPGAKKKNRVHFHGWKNPILSFSSGGIQQTSPYFKCHKCDTSFHIYDLTEPVVCPSCKSNNHDMVGVSVTRGRKIGKLILYFNNNSGVKGRHVTSRVSDLNNLKSNGDISRITVVTVKREWIDNKWKYFAIFTVAMDYPLVCGYDINSGGEISVDMGLSSVHILDGDYNYKTINFDIDGGIDKKEKKIANLQRELDIQKRLINPHKYNDDGTIKKGRTGKWINNSETIRLKNKTKTERGRQARMRKQTINMIANRLRNLGNTLLIEDLNIREWQQRKKKDDKNYKNWGRQVQLYAPSLFLSICKRKFGEVKEMDVYKAKPSRHCPQCGTIKDDPSYDYRVKIFVCDSCDFECDRNLLSCINQKAWNYEKEKYDLEKAAYIISRVDCLV